MMIWQRLGLRDGLYLGFCGAFIFIARAAPRLRLQSAGLIA